MKLCPFCREEVQDEAIKCKWCAERLTNEDDPDRETVLLDEHPGWLFYYKHFLLGTILLPLAGIGLLVWIYAALDRGGRKYRVTNHRITVKKGILNKDTSEVSIIDLKNVSIRQSLAGRILNYGDVVGGTAGTSGNEMMIEGAKDPVRFKDTIAKQKSLLTR